MPILAEYIKNHHRSDQIKGIIGITTLHKGVERLGFEAVEPANQFYRVFKKLTQIPILYLTTKQFSLRKNSSFPIFVYLERKIVQVLSAEINKKRLMQKMQQPLLFMKCDGTSFPDGFRFGCSPQSDPIPR